MTASAGRRRTLEDVTSSAPPAALTTRAVPGTAPSVAPDVAEAVTAYAHTHLETAYAGNKNHWERETVARSRWLPPSLAHRFAASSDPRLRAKLAGNTATPPELLARFLTDNEHTVAYAALANPATPYDAVAAAADAIGDVTTPLRHPDCPATTLAAAVVDPSGPDGPDRVGVALPHPNLPANIIHELATATRSRYRAHLLESPHLTHAEAISFLDTVGMDTYIHFTKTWAKNPNADPAWLARLADRPFDDPEQGTLAHVADNPSTPPSALTRIITGHAHRTRALRHPRCTPEAFHLGLDATDARTGAGAMPRERRPGPVVTQNAQLLAAIATNPSAPLDALDRIAAATLSYDERRYGFALAHARTADDATTLLMLAPQWRGTLGDLVASVRAITAPAAPNR